MSTSLPFSRSQSAIQFSAARMATGAKSSSVWLPSERLMIWLPSRTAWIIQQATVTSLPMPSLSTAR